MKIGRVTFAVSVPQVGSIVLENIELTPEEFKNLAELLGIIAKKETETIE